MLFPWLTVHGNVAAGLVARRILRQRQADVDEYIRLVGLDGFQRAYPHQLSGGMAQRAALARSLVNHPKVLLLDEPLGALDAFTRMNLQDEILRIWQERRTTMVLVTHDVDEAIYMSDRIIIMSPRPGAIQEVLAIPLGRPRSRNHSGLPDAARAHSGNSALCARKQLELLPVRSPPGARSTGMRTAYRLMIMMVVLAGICGGAFAALCVWKNPERDMVTLFPAAAKYVPQLVKYTPAQLPAIEKRLGAHLDPDETEVIVYHIYAKGFVPLGTVLCNQTRGKFGAIHTVTGFDAGEKFVGVLVQKHGEPVEFTAIFLQQFKGKTLSDPLAVGKDITPIDGYTRSCAAVAFSVKKSAAIFTVVVSHSAGKG